MWIVDDEFLAAVANGADPYITTVTAPREQPYVDIEVVSDLRLTKSNQDEFARQFRRLRRPFNEGRPSHMLVHCGDITPDGLTDESWQTWSDAYARIRPLVNQLLMVPGNHDIAADGVPFHQRFSADLLHKSGDDDPPRDVTVATVLRVRADDAAESSPPLACVVVIGFDSNEAKYHNGCIENHGQISVAQLSASRRLVKTLATTVALNTPLYVVGVTHHNLLPTQDRVFSGVADGEGLRADGRVLECQSNPASPLIATVCAANHLVVENTSGATANSSAVLAHCKDMRMSLLIHAHMYQREVRTVANTALVPGGSASELSIIACPSFARGTISAGMARLRLNVWKGEAEIAFSYDSDADGQGSAIQIVRPLVSASRVAASERRLYESVEQLIGQAARDATDDGAARVARFRGYFEKTWTETGYVALCDEAGTLPRELRVTRRTTYFLLLLLREREQGRYDVLLSHHTPLQPSQLGGWGTLLMPAFRNVRILLEHLRDDVMRQILEQAQDLEKTTHVRAFEAAVDRILDEPDNIEQDVWEGQLCEIQPFTRSKISPTNGCVTEYEYRLVTLLPFVRRQDEGVPNDFSGSADQRAAARQRLQDYIAIMSWLNELPTVCRPGDERRGPRIPIEVLYSDGGGLRYEPTLAHDARRQPLEAGSIEQVPPGAVWFPLPDNGDEPGDSPWRRCTSIVARNADVMASVEAELAKRREADGSFPNELVVGKLSTTGDDIMLVGDQFPFTAAAGGHKATAEVPCGSTLEALSKVTFIAGYDLGEGPDRYPYRDRQIVRSYLVRRQIEVRSVPRSVIAIFAAETNDRGSVLRADIGGALGLLRPVQRYVMRAGLERAGLLYDKVTCKLDDEWGFARIRKGDAPRAVAITPPIVEQLHPIDWEDDQGVGEFVLCDGNHRVVELVWNRGVVLAAVAVLGDPVQPYYAKPFSRFEWDYTAENVQDKTPDQPSKYAVRKVDISTLGPASAAILQDRPEKDWYRRYYRDLSKGFGYLGGQGGRYV